MRGEAMAQRVWRGRLGDARRLHGSLEGPLERLGIQVVAADHAATRIDRQALLGKDPEPGPARTGTRILARERVGQLHSRLIGLDIG